MKKTKYFVGMKLYVIIALIVVLLLILFYNVYYEEFSDLPKPVTTDSPVRSDFSCADSDQKNIFDRFDYVKNKKLDGSCPSDYVGIDNYFGLSNLCLPNCPSGYTLSPVDNTLCIANVCHNSPDLSGNIRGSWFNTCSVIYKQQYNLTSTIASISTVTRNFKDQFNSVNFSYGDLRTSLNNYNCSQDPAKCAIRDRNMNNITSNYTNLYNLTSNISYNYNYLSNRKAAYDKVYYDLLCDRY